MREEWRERYLQGSGERREYKGRRVYEAEIRRERRVEGKDVRERRKRERKTEKETEKLETWANGEKWREKNNGERGGHDNGRGNGKKVRTRKEGNGEWKRGRLERSGERRIMERGENGIMEEAMGRKGGEWNGRII